MALHTLFWRGRINSVFHISRQTLPFIFQGRGIKAPSVSGGLTQSPNNPRNCVTKLRLFATRSKAIECILTRYGIGNERLLHIANENHNFLHTIGGTNITRKQILCYLYRAYHHMPYINHLMQAINHNKIQIKTQFITSTRPERHLRCQNM